MNKIVRFAALISLSFWMLAPHPVFAAAAKATFFACKDQAVFKKPFLHPAGKAENPKDDKAKSDAYFKAKVATGDCTQLAKGEELSVDQRAGDLWCVRPTGGLDCFWTAEKAVDLTPSLSSGNSQGQRGSRRH